METIEDLEATELISSVGTSEKKKETRLQRVEGFTKTSPVKRTRAKHTTDGSYVDLDDDVTLNVLVDGRELVDHKDIDADQLGGGTLVGNGLQRRGGRGCAFLRGTIFNDIAIVVLYWYWNTWS